VKLFGFGQSLPSRAQFQEAHFVKQLESVLWINETVLNSEFVKEGNDLPEKEPCFNSTQKQASTKMLSGHSFHHLAITNWRILIGYPASGRIASFAFAKNVVTIFSDENGKNISIATKYDKTTKYETYITSEKVSKLVEANHLNPIPTPADQTQFLEYPEDWGSGSTNDGQRLIAEISRKQSGSDYAIIKQCEVCGERVFSPELYPLDYFDQCHRCLRKVPD